ncbi:hypothetical protein AC1031_022038 [Aphanomyces cochlioides]|nr:hypothetical protein AC1031_022038 [Aphanomyces cochlioides]
MQLQGLPIKRKDIMVKAYQIAFEIHPGMKIENGRYKGFRHRNPQLTNRLAQTISHARNAVDESGVSTLFSLLEHQIETHELTPDRIWNMDETAFILHKKSGKVIAVKGSRNVWLQTLNTGYHLSIAACVSADGVVFPPTFIFPGDSIERTLSTSCSIPGATISTAPKGWMNEDLFVSWLRHFSYSVGFGVKRPILLTIDGLSSHCTPKIVETAEEMAISLLCLPSNATHLLQPLDVSVFKSFKSAVDRKIFEAMVHDDTGNLFTLCKERALRIASSAWLENVSAKNVVAGFSCCGIWPLSKSKMMERLERFKANGVGKRVEQADWIKHRDAVRAEILTLPPIGTAKKRTKRVVTGARLLSISELCCQLLIRQSQTAKEQRDSARN